MGICKEPDLVTFGEYALKVVDQGLRHPRMFFQSFPVRSLGWVEMAEQDLCEGRSSVAVHHCIRQLSYCRRDIRDSAGVWGEVSRYGIHVCK